MKQPFKHSFTILIFPKASSKSISTRLLYARIMVGGRRAEFSIQRSIDISTWDSKRGKVKGNSIEARILNMYINKVKAEIVEFQNQLRKDNIVVDAATIKSNV